MKEKTVRGLVREHITQKYQCGLFPNPVGKGYVGKCVSFKNGVAVIENARIVDFGLFPGSPDDVGWRSIIVTPDLVGKRIAIAVGFEYKKKKGQRRKKQKDTIKKMQEWGCIAAFIEGIDDAERAINQVGKEEK